MSSKSEDEGGDERIRGRLDSAMISFEGGLDETVSFAGISHSMCSLKDSTEAEHPLSDKPKIEKKNHLLYNLHNFNLDKDDLIDLNLACHPGITNTQVTREAGLYVAYLNLLTVFDVVDTDCDGFIQVSDLEDMINMTCCDDLGGEDGVRDKLATSYAKIVLAHRTKANGTILYREFPHLITHLCGRSMSLLSKVVRSMIEIRNLRHEYHRSKSVGRRKTGSKLPSKLDSTNPKGHRVAFVDNPVLREIVAELPSDAGTVAKAMQSFPRRCWQKCFGELNVGHAFAAFVLWQMTFTCWYAFYPHTKFRFDRAFYYSAQAGLSVGFGALSESVVGGVKTDCPSLCAAATAITNCTIDKRAFADPLANELWQSNLSRVMTIINVILGSSIIGGALSYFIQIMIDRNDALRQKIEARENRKLAITRHKSHIDELRNVVSAGDRSYYARFQVVVLDNLFACHRCCWSAVDNKGNILTILAVVVFISTGVTYGITYEKWSFVESLYFAVTTISTGGLQSPSVDEEFSMIFTGFYVLIGVPLYAYCLGKFADFLVNRSQERKIKEAVDQVVTLQEFQWMEKLRKTKERSISAFEFLQMELLRTGKCDESFLAQVSERFDDFDIRNNGEITIEELIAANIFESYDVDDSGCLEFDEFEVMLTFFLKGHWVKRFGSIVDISDDKNRRKDIRRIFKACDTDGSGTITRDEFLEWICHIAVNQKILWRGYAYWHQSGKKGTQLYVLVLTTHALELRRADGGNAVFSTTEAIPVSWITAIRFDRDGGFWVTTKPTCQWKGQVFVFECKSRQKAVKLEKSAMRIKDLEGKIDSIMVGTVVSSSSDSDDNNEEEKVANDDTPKNTRNRSIFQRIRGHIARVGSSRRKAASKMTNAEHRIEIPKLPRPTSTRPETPKGAPVSVLRTQNRHHALPAAFISVGRTSKRPAEKSRVAMSMGMFDSPGTSE